MRTQPERGIRLRSELMRTGLDPSGNRKQTFATDSSLDQSSTWAQSDAGQYGRGQSA